MSLDSCRQRRQQIVYLRQLLVAISHRQSPPMRPYAAACTRACLNPSQPVDTARGTLAGHTSRRNHRTSIPFVRCVAPIVGICASCRTQDKPGFPHSLPFTQMHRVALDPGIGVTGCTEVETRADGVARQLLIVVVHDIVDHILDTAHGCTSMLRYSGGASTHSM